MRATMRPKNSLSVTHTHAEDMCTANDYAAQNALDVEPMLTGNPIYKYAINKNTTFRRQMDTTQSVQYAHQNTLNKRWYFSF